MRALLKEVDLVLASRDILTQGERQFFEAMKRLCEASLATGQSNRFLATDWHGSR